MKRLPRRHEDTKKKRHFPIFLTSYLLNFFVSSCLRGKILDMMKFFSKLTVGLVVAGCLSSSVYAEIVDRIVAVVNRKVITLYQLQQAEKAMLQEGNSAKDITPAGQEKVLNFLIENELIRQQAEEEGILVTEEDLNAALADIKQRNKLVSDDQLKQAIGQEGKTWQEFLEEIRSQIKMAKLTNQEVQAKVEITETEVKTYYQSHTELFKPVPPTVHVRHILLKVKEGADDAEIQKVKARADQIVQQLRAGADFATLAKEYSEHPSAQSGGEMGTFKQGELAAPFDIAFNLNVGDISDPVRSNSGFHILNVQEKSSGDQSTYENAQPQIRNTLFEEKANDLYQKWMTALKDKAYIEVKK